MILRTDICPEIQKFIEKRLKNNYMFDRYEKIKYFTIEEKTTTINKYEITFYIKLNFYDIFSVKVLYKINSNNHSILSSSTCMDSYNENEKEIIEFLKYRDYMNLSEDEINQLIFMYG